MGDRYEDGRSDSDDDLDETQGCIHREIAQINPRDRVLQDLRRHYGGIIHRQDNHIGILYEKLWLLKIIAGVLLILAILIKLSSSPCEVEDDPFDTSSIQQVCMRDKVFYNCDKDFSKGNPNWKMCEEIANCLKDPLQYKSKQTQK